MTSTITATDETKSQSSPEPPVSAPGILEAPDTGNVEVNILDDLKENSNIKDIPETCEMHVEFKAQLPSQPEESNTESNTHIPYIQNETYNDIKQKLNVWCQLQTQTAISEMKLNEHYKIQVEIKLFENCTTDENGEVELKLNNLDAKFVCITCGVKLKLHLRSCSFTIANATRHILRCVQNSASGNKPSPTVETYSQSCPKSPLSAPSYLDTFNTLPSLPDVWTIAAEVGLQDQVKECLIATGFDTIPALAELTDVSIIEKFLRENHFLMNPVQLKNLYGLYECNPEVFKFLPGHLLRLEALIKRCIEAQKLLFQPRKKCTAVKVKPNNHITFIRKKTYDEIKQRLKIWCEFQTQTAISQMKLNKHYEIQVLLKRFENSTTDESKLYNLDASFICLLCGEKIKLHLGKCSFMITNASRHILRCVQNFASGKKPKTKQQRRFTDFMEISSQIISEVSKEESPNLTVECSPTYIYYQSDSSNDITSLENK